MENRLPILSFHVLTAMAPHNVNRDEDGRPKTAFFGDTMRGRISSQSKKRALRFAPHFSEKQRALRTRELGVDVFRRLTVPLTAEAPGEPLNDVDAAWIALAVNHAVGGGGDFPEREDAASCVEPWLKTKKASADQIAKLKKERGDQVAKFREEGSSEADANRRVIEEALGTEQGLVVSRLEIEAARAHVASLRKAMAAGTIGVALEVALTELKRGLLSQSNTDLDLALFGRMVASMPGFNIEAAASVSHAITTHAFDIGYDYFSAGEELNVTGGTGAAITSYAFYGAGVYYQHAALDLRDLVGAFEKGARDRNECLALAKEATRLFIEGLLTVQPKGKRNSFASDTAAVHAILRIGTGPTVNLGFAFLDPVRASRDQPDLALASIDRLEKFDLAIAAAYEMNDKRVTFEVHPDRRKGNAPAADQMWTLGDFVDCGLEPIR